MNRVLLAVLIAGFRDNISMAKKRAATVANPIQKGGLACLKHSNERNIESPPTLHNLISTRFMPISFAPIGRKAFREKQWSAPSPIPYASPCFTGKLRSVSRESSRTPPPSLISAMFTSLKSIAAKAWESG